MRLLEVKDWQLDVDKYINSYLPRNCIHLLPKPLSHFLGHRDTPRRQIGNLLVAGWAFLGAFVGVIVIEATFMIPAIHDHGVPLLIASFVRPPIPDCLRCYSLLAGRCSDSRVQRDRVSSRSASKCDHRTYSRRFCRHWDHKALHPQLRL